MRLIFASRFSKGYRYSVSIFLVFVFLFLNNCAGTSRLYPNGAPENSFRLVEVNALSTTSDVQNNRAIYEPLAIAKITDAHTRDRSIGAGRVYCCDGEMPKAFFHYFYIPPGFEVDAGDIVEIKSGSLPREGKSSVNTLVRVVQKKDDLSNTCRWEPHDRTYGRVLYCDWMPKEGWVKYTFGPLPFDKTWIKPAAP